MSQSSPPPAPVAWMVMTIRDMQQVNAERSARWMAGSPGWTILEIAGELAGEVGEMANVCKKLRRSEMGVPGNKVSDDELRRQARGEMADVFIVLMLTASKLGIDLYDSVCETFNAKSEQMGFPERFGAAPFSSALPATTPSDGRLRNALCVLLDHLEMGQADVLAADVAWVSELVASFAGAPSEGSATDTPAPETEHDRA